MINQQYYSEKLRLRYHIKENFDKSKIVVFEDGIEYNAQEMSKLKGLSNNMMINIHCIKSIFGGVIEWKFYCQVK